MIITIKNALFMVCLLFSANVVFAFQDQSFSVKEKGDSLQKYLGSADMFVRFFPSNFEELKLIYGYSLKGGVEVNGYLHSEYYAHLNFFFDDVKIEPQEKVKRVIEISKDGVWQADGVGYFQLKSHELVSKNLELFVNELNKCVETQILSFWHFYYDGPHPENYKKDYENLYSKVKAIDNRIAELMKQSYEKLLKESDGRGH